MHLIYVHIIYIYLIHSPGRLAELVFKLGKIKLGMVRAVVIDEADQMLTEPYMDELTTVLEAIPMFRRGTGGAGGVGGSSSSSQTTAIVRAAPTSVDDILDEEEDSDDTTENSTTSSTGHNSNPSTSSSDPSEITSNNTLETKRELTSYICLASATSTTNEAVLKIANKYLRPNWQSIVMDSTLQLPPSITHGLISIPRIRALEMLRKFLNAQPSKCLTMYYDTMLNIILLVLNMCMIKFVSFHTLYY